MVQGNDSALGGGIYLLTASCYYQTTIDAVIADNVVQNNHAVAPLAISDPACQLCIGSIAPCGTGDGGGVFVSVDDRLNCGDIDHVTISGNTIRDNTAENFNLDPCTAICEGDPARGSEWRVWDLHVHSPASNNVKISYEKLMQ